MSKAKHPANMMFLTDSEHFLLNFARICPTIIFLRLYKIHLQGNNKAYKNCTSKVSAPPKWLPPLL